MQQSCMHPHQDLTDALASVALVWIRPCSSPNVLVPVFMVIRKMKIKLVWPKASLVSPFQGTQYVYVQYGYTGSRAPLTCLIRLVDYPVSICQETVATLVKRPLVRRTNSIHNFILTCHSCKDFWMHLNDQGA